MRTRKMSFLAISLVLLCLVPALNAPQTALAENEDVINIKPFMQEILKYTEELSSFDSRMTGYKGYYRSVEFVYRFLSNLPGVSVEKHEFYTAVPMDRGAEILLVKERAKIQGFSLHPNLVALGGAKKLEGVLVYAGRGHLSEINGKEVAGAIAVLEFDSGNSWINLLGLGAKGLIFLESSDITRIEALKKITLAPLDIPRIFVPQDQADALREAAKKGEKVVITTNYRWEKVKAYNIIAKIEGTAEPRKTIILTAHLDSASIVPALSPGAEEAVNPALLLYLAKRLSERRESLKYSVWLVFLSGHWQGLSGSRWFVEDYFFNQSKGIGVDFMPYITINFDLSSGSSKMVIYPGGFFYGHRTTGAMNLYRDLEMNVIKWIKEFKSEYPAYYEAIASEAFHYNEEAGVVVTNSFRSGYAIDYAQPFVLDSEPMGLAKSPAVSLLTFKDIRLKVFTPQDSPEEIRWDNLEPQLAFSFFFLNKVISDLSSVHAGSWEVIRPTRLEVDPVNGGFGYADVYVEVLEYDPTVPTLYKHVPNALVVIHKITWYYNVVGSLGVTAYDPFAQIIELTDENGRIRVVGLAPQEAFTGNIEVFAYKVDERGRLTYVPDMGPNGLGKFSPAPPHLKPGTIIKAVAFESSSIFAPYIMVPDQPWLPITFNLYSKPLFPVPYTHYTNPIPVSMEAFYKNLVRPESYAYVIDYENKFLLVFAPPNRRIQVMVSLTGLQRRAVLLLNLSEGELEGNGYLLGGGGSLTIVPNALLEYVRELYAISKSRYERAVLQGIRDSNIEELIVRVEKNLRIAEEMSSEKRYDEAFVATYRAWSAAIELYERMKTMYMDFTNAVIIIMVVVAPFAVLMEKFMGVVSGLRRIVTIVVSAGFAFGVFVALHPGFSIVYSVPALTIGIIMLVLSVPTVFFLLLNFNRSLGQIRRKQMGMHFLEREVFDMFVAAMSIGVENMKKRLIRTALTMLTIVLIVMSLVSLTSVIPVLRIVEKPYPTAAEFSGILIQSQSNEPLDPVVEHVIQGIAGKDAVIMARYWLYPAQEGATFTLLSEEGEFTSIKALIGVSPEDLKYALGDLELDPELFRPKNSIILPTSLASALGVELGDKVIFNGYTLRVAGIFDDTLAYQLVRDIDDVEGSPQFLGLRPYDVAKMVEEQRFEKTFRLLWSEVAIVNSEFLEDVPGAFVMSIEVVPADTNKESLLKIAREIYKVFSKLEVYAAFKGEAVIISSRFAQEFFGFSFIVTPVIIAGLVLATTILSGVQERTREMSIYSSLGLAPLHVAGMFLAETLTYAIIGAVMGYVGGIAMARIFNFAVATGGVIGMNYSSSSVLVSLGIVIILVLLASVYPFLLVSKLVTPSLERKWKIPTRPKDNIWEIPLPFTFREDEMVLGLSLYFMEFFEAHKVERAGTFTIAKYSLDIKPSEAKISGIAWLAPYEQDIRQEFVLRFSKSLTENKYFTQLYTKRISGPYDSWINSNESFAREIRKQLLTWRLLTPQEREKYIKEGMKLVGGRSG